MLPFFDRWMKAFPDVKSLAAADEETVLKNWEGLGYYSRARNIHRAAKILEKDFPQSPDELLKIPGIGPYTSAAIASIAFDRPAVAVDGNVTRVLSRYFGVTNPFGDKEDAKKILELARELAQYSQPGERGVLTQALMELGATVCKPNAQLKCFECPVGSNCAAKKAKKAEAWPLPKKRAEMKKLSRLLLVYRDKEGRPLLRKRPAELALGGQWELPYLDLEAGIDQLKTLFGPHFELRKPYKHTIMNKSFTVLPLELGQGPSARAVDPAEQQYHSEGFKGVLSTISRKYLGRNY